jgi:1-acyl-sn-glycerol-3-phosphate acyltransferase
MTVEHVEVAKTKTNPTYDHTRLEPQRKFLRFLIRWIGFSLLAKLDHVEGLENIPENGPAIVIMNHIAFIDSLVVLHVIPRNIVPLAKVEVLDYPIIRIFPKLWHVIPVKRDEFDRTAIKMVMEVLQAGEIVLLAPEGTRGTALQQGKEGVAYLASRSGAPIIPVAIEGTIGLPAIRFSKRWRQPGAVVKFGRPFRFRTAYRRASRDQLRLMTDEAMYILAGMLPAERRGVYQDLSEATQTTVEWVDL